MLAIESQKFSLSFSKGKSYSTINVLKNISLSIKEGEIIGIIGPSGCGKTTLLRTVAGLITASSSTIVSGSLKIYNLPPFEAKQKRFFSFAFQNPILLPWRSVRKNIQLPLEIMGVSTTVSNTIVDDLLAMVGMQEFNNAMPAEISGGMRQRVSLARALAQEPKILLMDEPFGSLDEVTREKLNFDLLRIHKSKKTTILFVTHNLTEATLLADRVCILTGQPARIREILDIKFSQERDESILYSKELLEMTNRVRRSFTKETAAQ